MDNTPKPNDNRYRRFYQQIAPLIRKAYPRSYMAPIFSFLVVSLFAWYALKPTIQTILLLRREIADKTAVSQKMEDKIQALVEAEATLDNLSSQLPLADQALPPNSEIVELGTQLRNIAAGDNASISAIQANGVALVGASPSAKEPVKQIEVPLAVVVSGSYPSMQDFLTKALDLRRILKVDTLSITPFGAETASKSAGTNLRLVLRFNTYFLSN